MSKTNTGKKKYIVLKVVLAVFVIAFFASILYTPVYDSLAPEHIKNFNQEQALEDYDYMWEVLEANFPHFNVASRKYGTNYIEVKNRYRKYIEENKNIDFIKNREHENEFLFQKNIFTENKDSKKRMDKDQIQTTYKNTENQVRNSARR